YGLSLSVKNTRLVFKQGSNDPFSKEREIIDLSPSACDFDKVVIQGKGYVSTEALERLAQNNINVMMLDKRGKLYSYFHQIAGHEPLIRQNQYDCFRDEKQLEYLRKWVVKQRIESQIQLFKELVAEPKRVYNSYNEKWQVNNNQHSSMNYSLKVPEEIKGKIKRAISFMEAHYHKVNSAHMLRAIMKVESDIAKLYYPTFAQVLRPELGFRSRNSHRTFRPADASDVINGLLNYGISILYAEVTKQLNALGLDCFIGFYHRNHASHLALVYDMAEPFRHLIDRSAFEIQDQIRKKDYAFSRKGIVVLSQELKKSYVELLSSMFDRKRDYKARTGIRRSDG
ncbi:MAG: CRISPR-associated endonuclease Cas1, partial [Nitrososphaera sp.]